MSVVPSDLVLKQVTYFVVIQCFEEWRDADQAYVVVPSYHKFGTFTRIVFELVLEYWESVQRLSLKGLYSYDLRSKLSRPVCSWKPFFSLVYGICFGYSMMSSEGYTSNF